MEAGGSGVLGVVGAVLNKVARKNLTEQLTFGQISEEGEKVNHMAIWEKNVRQRAQ